MTGEHAFIWGPWSVSSGEYAGLVAASAAFSTVGGPHDFRMEGLGDWAFYEQVGSIPYATPEVSPAAFTVPWRDEGELEGSVAYGPKDARVTYALSTEGFVRLAEDDAAFVVDQEAFLTAGAQPTNAVVRLTQTYDRQAVTNEVAVLLSPATTSLTLSPGSITVSNADDGGPATAEDACACACAEGTQAEAGCVSFRQVFGRTPRLAGMPQGALAIEAHNLSDGLFTPAALRYDHPMMRRLNRVTGVVTDPMGRTVAYGRDGYPVGQDVARDSRLEIAADGTARETFADRSAVEYGQDGRVAALVSPEGVRATPAELGITVAHDAQGRIAQILSEADGSLTVSALSPTAYSVAWADTEGCPVKTFAFSKEGTDTLLLMDGPFPVRWTWVPENHDFAMVRGEGDEAVTTARSVVYDGASVNVAKTVSRGGAVASAETETLDSRNGNAVVGRTVGGRTTLAATRVTAGDGLGRIATRTDERGLTTAFTYDAHGRTLTRTESAPGLDPRVTTYGYAADPLDRRPWFTTERVGGVTTRTASFMEAMDADGGRVEATSDCGLVTTTFHWPATAANRVAAGRVRAVVRPDGRMTTHDYAYDAATGTVTETATEGLDADGYGTFATVDGKSTRTLTTRDARGDAVRIEREALIGGAWVPLTWETRTYNAAHRHVGSAWSNGKSYASAWNCTGPIWEIDTRGIATTNVYDSLKRLVSSTRHGPRGALTTAYTRDAAGRATQTARGGLVSAAAYDTSGRTVAETDGRGNTLTRAYDALGRLASLTDEAGATTAFAYDAAGRLAAVTNALGNVTFYEYDLRGNTTYAGGAVYPVAYAYDLFGNRTSMTTYRDETGTGDTTAWAYDAATGAVLSKTFADGRGLAYTLTDLGQVATRTDARGTVTAYAYNVYGDLVSQTYSDGTPSVTYEYDALGRQTRATDAAGTTTFTYGAYGELETETVSGLYAKTLTRHRDALGRDAGYSVDGARQTTIAYDPATGRIAGMDGFAWEYLPGSDLKSKLTYPNGATAEWAYEPHRDLLTRVTNTLGGEVLSQFDYTNDLLGRRTEIGKSGSAYDAPLTETYAYDARNQLISGQGLAYAYDDIGNRTAAEDHAYAANALNQYTAIDAFVPEYDADGIYAPRSVSDMGNQTLVRTDTGLWQVTYPPRPLPRDPLRRAVHRRTLRLRRLPLRPAPLRHRRPRLPILRLGPHRARRHPPPQTRRPRLGRHALLRPRRQQERHRPLLPHPRQRPRRPLRLRPLRRPHPRRRRHPPRLPRPPLREPLPLLLRIRRQLPRPRLLQPPPLQPQRRPLALSRPDRDTRWK